MGREKTVHETFKADRRSWLIVLSIAASFLLWGLFVFKSVGDKGQPGWNFGIVEDIPGQSTYSTHRPNPIFTTPPALTPQHVPGVTPNPNPLTKEDMKEGGK